MSSTFLHFDFIIRPTLNILFFVKKRRTWNVNPCHFTSFCEKSSLMFSFAELITFYREKIVWLFSGVETSKQTFDWRTDWHMKMLTFTHSHRAVDTREHYFDLVMLPHTVYTCVYSISKWLCRVDEPCFKQVMADSKCILFLKQPSLFLEG